MPLIIAVLFAAVIVAIVVWIGSSGWLLRSGMEDLARRRRLLSGTDPLQLTAQQAADSATRSYRRAHEGLIRTVDDWYGLRTTLGIDTPIQFGYAELRAKAEADPAFTDLLERANSACIDNAAAAPESVTDLIAEAARMDAMTLEIRSYLHRARPPKPPKREGRGGLFR